MQREERPDLPVNYEGIDRMVGMRSLDLFDEPVRFLADRGNLPDDLPGDFLPEYTEVPISPPGILDCA